MADVYETKQFLSVEQYKYFEKYAHDNYIKRLDKRSKLLTVDEIMDLERMTRGQANNPLWRLLRLYRQTASSSSSNVGLLHESAALSYGVRQEHVTKTENKMLIRLIKDAIEKESGKQIIHTVLESGMFITPHGLHAASPDAYFVLEDGLTVPLEIKCPYTYRDMTADEVRQNLNTRKSIYRLPKTAFKVNRSGEPIYEVVKTDPHYRQMQRQMYVMDSPFAVYLVKFNYDYVASIVPRDWQFTDQLEQQEEKEYRSYQNRNKLKEGFSMQSVRLLSFNRSTYCDSDKERLALEGFYYNYGDIVCVFCDTSYDSFDNSAHSILTQHRNENTCDKRANEASMDVVYRHYLPISKRVDSLPSDIDKTFATQGIFYEEGIYKLFCCGTELPNLDIVPTHKPNCEYFSILSKPSII
ncbi:ALK-EXO [Operophtera brumata nucleopolyhedrovirus]|uniref:ALK-EXO n=1 Tax=Operophtera brumata nucleopolyhedrovirus TaxID=1046267 RepID=A0A2H4V007_9ABAC|nr:ALK-EXO [Operophtera brumata nucleopolyhedrovirus]AUA60338.1 ALK-EXO [Operophtera brumata nucleopolyhedrovirus]